GRRRRSGGPGAHPRGIRQRRRLPGLRARFLRDGRRHPGRRRPDPRAVVNADGPFDIRARALPAQSSLGRSAPPRKMIGALRSAAARFYAVDGLFLAAGLAVSSLICMILLVLLSVSTVGFVLSGEQTAH